MKKNQKKFRFLCTGNQNGGQRSTAWQPTDDDNDDRHISKKGRKGQIKQQQEQQKKKNRQRIKITGHKSASSQPAKCVIGLKESKKKKKGGGNTWRVKGWAAGLLLEEWSRRGPWWREEGKRDEPSEHTLEQLHPFPTIPSYWHECACPCAGWQKDICSVRPCQTRAWTHTRNTQEQQAQVLNKLSMVGK